MRKLYVCLMLVGIMAFPALADTMTFQQGVSPSSGYAHDGVQLANPNEESGYGGGARNETWLGKYNNPSIYGYYTGLYRFPMDVLAVCRPRWNWTSPMARMCRRPMRRSHGEATQAFHGGG